MVPRNAWVQAGHAVSPISGLAHEIHLPHVGSGNSGTRIPEILARSGAAGKTSSKFR